MPKKSPANLTLITEEKLFRANFRNIFAESECGEYTFNKNQQKEFLTTIINQISGSDNVSQKRLIGYLTQCLLEYKQQANPSCAKRHHEQYDMCIEALGAEPIFKQMISDLKSEPYASFTELSTVKARSVATERTPLLQ